MNADARGATGPNRRAPMPQGRFDAPASPGPAVGHNGQVVRFFGDDGRSAEFPLARLAILPGWTDALGRAFAARVGPAGQARTHRTATSVWSATVRFAEHLSALPEPPADPARLRPEHLTGFAAEVRRAYVKDRNAWSYLDRALSVLRLPPVVDMLAANTRDYLDTPRERGPRPAGGSGYSDGELHRLIARLRRDVAAIRDRVQAGQDLVERFHRGDVAPQERERARLLAGIAETGVVPPVGELDVCRAGPARRGIAGQLFLTPPDIVPISALLVVLSARNIETIKELPAEGRVLQDRAVEVVLTKRRRGAGRWFETAHWEVGPSGRELHHPGGLFLLVGRLTALSRSFSGVERLWAVWRNGMRSGVSGVDEHYDPFATDLQWPGALPADWSRAQDELWADPVGDEPPTRLVLDCARLRKSVEVRRTRQVGGHLPSATRSNTYPVLFANYLRGDASVGEWAQQTVSEALVEAEDAVLAAHRAALARAGGHLTVVPGEATAESIRRAGVGPEQAERIASGGQDAAWNACANPERHPETGTVCRTVSLLDCFHCGNCVVTREHLPRLLALLDALHQRRRQLGEQDWWHRYGPTWVALRRDILDGRHFTETEIAHARGVPATEALLDLVENPWENTP
ncbi:hypothetical protein [Saccharothrix stipae]